MKVMRDGRWVTVEVTADGAGLVSHAGTDANTSRRSRGNAPRATPPTFTIATASQNTTDRHPKSPPSAYCTIGASSGGAGITQLTGSWPAMSSLART